MDKFDQIRRGAGRARPAMAFEPDPGAVERLIEAARRSPLGVEFLRRGALDSVAATFQVHAFVVDRARDRLGREPD